MKLPVRLQLVSTLSRVVREGARADEKDLQFIVETVSSDEDAWELAQEWHPELKLPGFHHHPNAAITYLRSATWPSEIERALLDGATDGGEDNEPGPAVQGTRGTSTANMAPPTPPSSGQTKDAHVTTYGSPSKAPASLQGSKPLYAMLQTGKPVLVQANHPEPHGMTLRERRFNEDRRHGNSYDPDTLIAVTAVEALGETLRKEFLKALRMYSSDMKAADVKKQEWLRESPDELKKVGERLSFLEERFQTFHFYFLRGVVKSMEQDVWRFNDLATFRTRIEALTEFGGTLLTWVTRKTGNVEAVRSETAARKVQTLKRKA